MYKPTVYKNITRKPPEPIVIDQFRGVDFSANATQVALNRSPDALNMIPDEKFFPCKRTGIKRVFQTVLGTGKVNGLHLFKTTAGTKIRLLHHGTKLYTWDDSGNQPTLIYSGMEDHDSNAFVMNNKLYLQDGTNYLVYDGTTVSDVTTNAYIPTLTMGRSKDGGGNAFENFNLINPYFKDSFSPDGTSKTYPLSLSGLDATPIVASLDKGVTFDKFETTHFTVDRVTGIVTWITAPPTGTDTMVIKAAKTVIGYADRIKKCTISAQFGGTNDTRVFLSGNPDFKNMDWRSGLYDPTYFPDLGYTKIGGDSTAIMGYKKQSNALMIIKEDSQQDATSFLRTFQLNSDGTVSYPIQQGTIGVGCIAKKSIQIIEDKPFFLSRKGIHSLETTSIANERNTSHKSQLIDLKLLTEPNLSEAVSTEYQRRYWVAINGNVYVMDEDMKYTDENGQIQYEWFFLNGINASCFLEDGYLYFGDSTQGMIWRFKTDSEVDPYTDDENTPIPAYWTTPLTNIGTYSQYKIVKNVIVTIAPNARTSADIYYNSDDIKDEFTESQGMSLFDFNSIDFNDWTFITSSMPKPIATNTKERKIVFFGVKVKNDVLGQSLGLYSIEIKYDFLGTVK